MIHKITNENFATSIVSLDSSNVKVGTLGGRYVEMNSQRWSMNSVVKYCAKWIKKTGRGDLQQTVLKKIIEIDACHPEKSSAFLKRVLTYVRQFFGNLFYNRKKTVRGLSQNLKIEKLHTAQKQESTKNAVIQTTPRKTPGQPIEPSPKKDEAHKQQKRTVTVVSNQTLELFQRREFDAKDEIDMFSRKVLFPTVSFFHQKEECLFDKLLLVSGIADEKERKKIKIKVAYHQYDKKKQLLNTEIVLKYLKEALIYARASDKAAIMEFSCEHLEPASLNRLLTGYCQYYLRTGKSVERLDTTLKEMIKIYADLHSNPTKKKSGEQIDRNMIVIAIGLLIPTDTSVGFEWCDPYFKTLREHHLISDDDILYLLDICKKSHSVYFQYTAYQVLFKMLPEQTQQLLLKDM